MTLTQKRIHIRDSLALVLRTEDDSVYRDRLRCYDTTREIAPCDAIEDPARDRWRAVMLVAAASGRVNGLRLDLLSIEKKRQVLAASLTQVEIERILDRAQQTGERETQEDGNESNR